MPEGTNSPLSLAYLIVSAEYSGKFTDRLRFIRIEEKSSYVKRDGTLDCLNADEYWLVQE